MAAMLVPAATTAAGAAAASAVAHSMPMDHVRTTAGAPAVMASLVPPTCSSSPCSRPSP